MRRWFVVLALLALAACAPREGATSGPTVSFGTGVAMPRGR